MIFASFVWIVFAPRTIEIVQELSFWTPFENEGESKRITVLQLEFLRWPLASGIVGLGLHDKLHLGEIWGAGLFALAGVVLYLWFFFLKRELARKKEVR